MVVDRCCDLTQRSLISQSRWLTTVRFRKSSGRRHLSLSPSKSTPLFLASSEPLRSISWLSKLNYRRTIVNALKSLRGDIWRIYQWKISLSPAIRRDCTTRVKSLLLASTLQVLLRYKLQTGFLASLELPKKSSMCWSNLLVQLAHVPDDSPLFRGQYKGSWWKSVCRIRLLWA